MFSEPLLRNRVFIDQLAGRRTSGSRVTSAVLWTRQSQSSQLEAVFKHVSVVNGTCCLAGLSKIGTPLTRRYGLRLSIAWLFIGHSSASHLQGVPFIVLTAHFLDMASLGMLLV